MSMNNNSSCKQQQCLVERRNRCRQLQRWNKSLLVLLGVEQVCQRLFEHSTWQQSSVLTVPSSLRCFETPLQVSEEPSSPTDWDPHETCYFCQERQDFMDQADLPSPNSSFDHSPTKPIMPEEQSEKTGSSLPLLPQDGMSSVGNQWQNGIASYPIWPMLPLFVTDQIAQNSAALASVQHPLAGSGISLMDGFSLSTPSERAFYAALNPETANDQPLDLSLKRKAAPRCREVMEEEQPQKMVSTSTLGGSRRTYSKEDLEAAVLDIRSGRLGTRRASVIYGVPRSTLRNKIHKLEVACGSMMARGGHKTVNSSQGVLKNNEFSEKGRLESSQPSEAAAVPAVSPNEQNQPGQHSGASRTLQELALQVCAKQLNSAFELHANQRAALNNFAMSHDLMSVACIDRSLPSVFLGAIGMEAVRSATRNAVVQAVNDVCVTSRSVTPVTGMLQKSIPYMAMPTSNGTLVSADISHFCPLDDPNSKKMRRKRGQYRKYDKNALALAVQSVRRGEMSVHKAGSFYGVPHSTLEYKVKERNLLRAKKQAEATANAKSLVNGITNDSSINESQSEELSTLVPSVTFENSNTVMYSTVSLSAKAVGNELLPTVVNNADPSEQLQREYMPMPLNSMQKEMNGIACEGSVESGSMVQWRKMRRKKGVPKKVVMVVDASGSGMDIDVIPLTTTN